MGRECEPWRVRSCRPFPGARTAGLWVALPAHSAVRTRPSGLGQAGRLPRSGCALIRSRGPYGDDLRPNRRCSQPLVARPATLVQTSSRKTRR